MSSSIKEKITEILKTIDEERLRHSRNDSVTLIAVSKMVSETKIREAYAAGQSIFGESKIQDAIEKIPLITDLDIRWHFIGHLQTNKVRLAVKYFQTIHSLDSERLAQEIDKEALLQKKHLDVLIQVNTSNEPQKYGIRPDQTIEFASKILPLKNITLKGLMTIGPLTEDETQIRNSFITLRTLCDSLQKTYPEHSFPYLSMGMTHDYRIAIEEGATHVRIGTAIFGDRHG